MGCCWCSLLTTILLEVSTECNLTTIYSRYTRFRVKVVWPRRNATNSVNKSMAIYGPNGQFLWLFCMRQAQLIKFLVMDLLEWINDDYWIGYIKQLLGLYAVAWYQIAWTWKLTLKTIKTWKQQDLANFVSKKGETLRTMTQKRSHDDFEICT